MMKACGGFSLIGVVIATVVLCVLATVMGPQLGSAASDARLASLCESLQNVRRHIEVYRRQHEGRLPASAGEAGEDFVRRLTEPGEGPADENSAPRLERMPVNPFNRLATVRVGEAPAGAGTHGWRFDPATGDFRTDDSCDADGDGLPEHTSL
jgi:type II secretory pathway pseudopilin PulG